MYSFVESSVIVAVIVAFLVNIFATLCEMPIAVSVCRVVGDCGISGKYLCNSLRNADGRAIHQYRRR